MRLRRTRANGSLSSMLGELFTARSAQRPRPASSLSGVERFEERKMLALSISGITTPAVGSTDVDMTTDLVLTFNEPVVKGQGNIYVVEQATGEAGTWIDVRDAAVTINGADVSIDLPVDLLPDNTYSVHIDPGAFLDSSTTPTAGATLLTQDFDFAQLDPFINEGNGDGTDFSTTDQFGFDLDTTLDPTKGIDEWRGWSFADKNSWISADNQSRDQFTLGEGTVMVADSDEYDDGNAPERPFVGYSYSPVIDLTGVAANSVKIEFDSSYRAEGDQFGLVEVSFDGGATWTQKLRLDSTNASGSGSSAAGASINERLVSGTTTGRGTDGNGGASFEAISNPDSGTMQFRWYKEGGNNWWWAVDDVLVTGDIVGVPFAGLTDETVWTFSTPESPRLSLSVDTSAVSENGGTATATLTRNAGPLVPSGELVVTLTSSDTTEATVPATITIPDGQLSVTFPITAVDDTDADRAQLVSILAAADPFASATASIQILDDEGPKVVSLTPAADATGVDYQTDLVVTFDQSVRKGAGVIRVVTAATGVAVEEIDVSSSAVTVSGAVMTIDLSVNLPGLTEYFVLMDDGVVTDTTADLIPASVLMQENFDAVALEMFPEYVGLTASERATFSAPGPDYTLTGPLDFAVDNALMPAGGSSPFEGWSFMSKNSWVAEQGDQSRSRFTLGSGVVAVADGDAWDDYPHDDGRMNTFLVTRPIDLAGITPGSVSLEFDSSYYHELPQFATVEVSYDGGTTWGPLLFFGDSSVPGINDGSSRNDNIVITSASAANDIIGGSIVDAPLNTPATGTLQFRFGYQEAGNNWWWAVDNIVVKGERAGMPFAGLTAGAWSFTTAEAPTLTVSLDDASIAETGTTTGTVSRNLSTTGALVVTLASSDQTAATVPATVTIPDGQASVTFTVTAVDDAATDGRQTAVISAAATDYFSVDATLFVEDDDFPSLVASTPTGGSVDVALDADIVLDFDMNVRKGNGFIHFVDTATGKSDRTINVNSADVTVAGSQVTINPPSNLAGTTTYAVLVDSGAFLSAATATSPGATLLTQDFELLPLGPAVLEINGLTPTGEDWTAVPPAEWSVDNSQMPPGGAPEWTGWTFAAKSFWETQGGQNRANFTLGEGTIAVADTDEWDDYARPTNAFNSLMTSAPVDLSTVAADSVLIEFDSSFRPEAGDPTGNQVGVVEFSLDEGVTWTNLLTLDATNSSGSATDSSVNRRESLSVANPGSGSMMVRWGQTGTNDYWWAIDNVVVSGTVNGAAFQGVTDLTAITFTTVTVPVLTMAIDSQGTAAEDAGVVNGTVTRDGDLSAELVVSLASSKTSEATVAATVTIPAGQASANFPITLVDNATYSGKRLVTITASAADLIAVASTLTITDDEAGSIVISEIMFNSDGTDQEWLELYNAGLTTVDLGGWVLDDEDRLGWDPIPEGTLLPAGGVAVLFDGSFGSRTAAQFREDWSTAADPSVVVVDVTGWQALANGPSLTNEVLVIRNAAGDVENEANYQDGTNGWPTATAGASFYLADMAGDNNVGANWAVSALGVDGAINPVGTVWTAANIASPGFVPVGPAEEVVEVGNGQTVTSTTVYTGDAVIVKTGNGTLILNLANTHTGGLRVDGGTVIIQNAAALNGGPLVIGAGATVNLDVGFALVPLSSLALDATARLDVGTGGVTVASGGFTAADIRAALISGRNGGTWDGTAGLTYTVQSANAAATAFSIGYAVDGNGLLTVRYTGDGDAQLDGKIDFDDILALFPNYGATGSFVWSEGDFTYDGKVDFDDILALFPNYGADPVFSAGVLGTGGGSGAGGGDNGSATTQSAGTSDGGDTTDQQPVMGPEAPADLPTKPATTLSRSGSLGGGDATSLAFAALASGEQSASGSGDKKKSVFATL